jgi:hypothetical protein
VVLAYNKIVPSTGPTQGVQPAANAIPIKNEPVPELEPVFHLQKINVENAQQIEAENDDQQAPNTPDVFLIGHKKLTDETGGGPESDEDHGKAGNEQKSIHDDRSLEL